MDSTASSSPTGGKAIESPYPIADAIIRGARIPPSEVESVSYYVSADGGESTTITLAANGHRKHARHVEYRCSAVSKRCSTCAHWDRLDGGPNAAGICDQFVASIITASVITPADLYCTKYEASEPSKHGDFIPEPEHDSADYD